MIVTEIDDTDLLTKLDNLQFLPVLAPAMPRTLGVVHLSDIYKIVMKRMFPARFGGPMNARLIRVGLIFETMLERGLIETYATVRPGELISDEGIYMTPDGVNPMLCAGEEYKATYMSCGKGISERVWVGELCYDIPLDKFLHWFIQMMGYARWLFVNIFILRVLFIDGDWKFIKLPDGSSVPNRPIFKSYRIEFTDKEIEGNWEMLMNVAREEGLLPC